MMPTIVDYGNAFADFFKWIVGSGDILYIVFFLFIMLMVIRTNISTPGKVFLLSLGILCISAILSEKAGVFGWIVGVVLLLLGFGAGLAALKLLEGY